MGKRVKTFLIISILFSYNLLFSQLYYPLRIGDKFVYFIHSSGQTSNGTYYNNYYHDVRKIIGDTTINDKKYYRNTIAYRYERVDSITNSLYSYSFSMSCPFYYYETLVDSLGMLNLGPENNCIENGSLNQIISETYWGHTSTSKRFNYAHYGGPSWNGINKYNSKFGLVYSEYHFMAGTAYGDNTETLHGCILNDTLYGDTNSVFIRNISSEIPSSFLLFQNFPNPFNPLTKIKYQILKNSFVSIKVFNIYGKEVSTLVSEMQNTGTYEVSFDATELSSGIYFCKLETNDFVQTNKMILLK